MEGKPVNYVDKMSATEGTCANQMQADAVKEVFKRECRMRALQSAERVNPSVVTYGQVNLQGNKPSVVSILADADKIYEWLIKDL